MKDKKRDWGKVRYAAKQFVIGAAYTTVAIFLVASLVFIVGG
jgi:hypothetical protein